MENRFQVNVNDYLPPISLVDENGPIDLSQMDSIEWTITDLDVNERREGFDPTPLDLSEGRFRFDFPATGKWGISALITWEDGMKQIIPNIADHIVVEIMMDLETETTLVCPRCYQPDELRIIESVVVERKLGDVTTTHSEYLDIDDNSIDNFKEIGISCGRCGWNHHDPNWKKFLKGMVVNETPASS